MEHIVRLWEKHLEPSLTPLWDSLMFWRSLALMLATLVGAAYLNRHRVLYVLLRHKYQEHDRKIFDRADKILPEELLCDALDVLESDHSSARETYTQMVGFERFYDLEANRFLNPRLHAAAKQLSDAVAKLTHFIAYNFFPYPSDSDRTCMYPELNMDRAGNGSLEQMRKYDQYRSQLEQFTAGLRKGYRSYRSEVKNWLLK
jgi:hypothetical protein